MDDDPSSDTEQTMDLTAASTSAPADVWGPVANTPFVLIVYGLDLRIIFISPDGSKLYGQRAETIVGRRDDELLPHEVTTAYRSIIDDAIATKSCRSSEVTFTVDGESFRILMHYIPVTDTGGEVMQLIAIGHDFSRRMKIETAVVKAREVTAQKARAPVPGRRTFEALMEYVPEGLLVATAPDGVIQMVSRFGRELAGRCRETIERIAIDRFVDAWDLYRADGVSRPSAEELPLTRAVMRGEVVLDEELVLGRPDGTKIAILCNAVPIRDKDGEVIGGIATWRDLSTIEAALQRDHEEFQDRVEERTAELARATEALQAEISKRLAIEEDLRASEERYVSVVESIGIGIALINRDMEILTLNRQMKQWFPAIDASKRLRCYRSFNSPPREGVCSGCPTVRALEDGLVHESTVETPSDGEMRFFRIVASPIRDGKGKVVAAVEMVEDVTERKRAREALLEQSMLLEAFFGHSLTPFVFLDRTFNFIRVNDAFAKAWQSDVEDFVGTNFFDVFPLQTRELFDEVVRSKTAIRNVSVSLLSPGQPDWGATCWDWTLVPILDNDGDIRFLVLSLLDMTESRRAEKALRVSEEKFSKAFHHSPDWVTMTSLSEGRYIEVNESFLRLTGFTREEAIGRTSRDLGILVDPAQREEMVRILKQNGAIHDQEVRFRMKSGDILAMRRSAELIDYNGEECVISVTHDVTEAKKAECRTALMNALLQLFTEKPSRETYLERAVELIADWSHCRHVRFRVWDRQGGACQSFSVGFDKAPDRLGEWLLGWTDDRSCAQHSAELTDNGSGSLVTASGSFFSNDAVPFFERLQTLERSDIRAWCAEKGLASIAVVPILSNGGRHGVMELADEAKGKMPLENVNVLESFASIIGEAFYRFTVEEELQRNYEAQRLMNAILRLSLRDIALNHILKECLDAILSIPWLQAEIQGGSIFTIGQEPELLILQAEKGLSPVHPRSCAKVSFGRCVCGKAAARKEIVYLDDVDPDHNLHQPGGAHHGHFAVPLLSGGQSVGVLNVTLGVGQRCSGKAEEFLASMANTLAGIIVRKRAEDGLRASEERLRSLTAHLHSIREEERANVAREIHDELGQALTALKMDLSWIRDRISGVEQLLLDKTASDIELIDKTIQAVKRICTELRPGILDHLGIGAAIEWQSDEFHKRTGIECAVRLEPMDMVLDKDRSTTVFRVFQETLTNVLRHAGATRVDVSLVKAGSRVELKVKDNGRGITRKDLLNAKSFGLIGVRERVHYWGGRVTISGAKNRGTTITVRIPLQGKGRLS